MDTPGLERFAGDSPPSETSSLTDIQIIGRLRSIHELIGETTHFEPGQIVRHKFPDLADLKNGHLPRVLVRYLDRPYVVADHPEAFDSLREWGSNISPMVYDCIMGSISQGSYSQYLSESEIYRIATEDDYGPGVNPND